MHKTVFNQNGNDLIKPIIRIQKGKKSKKNQKRFSQHKINTNFHFIYNTHRAGYRLQDYNLRIKKAETRGLT